MSDAADPSTSLRPDPPLASSTRSRADAPLRILQVSEQVSPVGGCERMLRDTVDLLIAAGHEVTTLVAEDSVVEGFASPIERLARTRGARDGLAAAARLDVILKGVRPDVIHIHNTQDYLSPLLVTRLARVAPTLRYVHDARLFCPQLRSKWLPRADLPCTYPMGPRCLANCYPIDGGDGPRPPSELVWLYAALMATRRLPAVAVGSGYMRTQLLLNGFEPSRVHLLSGFTHKAREALPSRASASTRLLAIGRFDSAKGLQRLPDIFDRLTTPDWRATIVGGGAGLEATRAHSAALGQERRVEFVGQVPSAEIDALYRSADVVVMPSQVPEAFGLVGIEAMAFGKPVVAFDTGGVREWLKDGETGFLVPAGDEADFARRVDDLLARPDERCRLGRQGREQVELRFRPERHLRQLLDLYTALVAGAPRTAWASA